MEFVLHGHTRAITDINFSAHHPDVLATCAVDSFVHCWDLRVPARPVISFSDWFAGATQVKWSRQVSHVIASSHEKYLRIWDDRMGAYPVRSVEAHDTKIYGIDWNRHEENRIVTCSLDKSIKFWDCNSLEDVPERVIGTPFPAWRARHTPFGYGLLAMPQRGNGDLHLYDRRFGNAHHVSGTVPPVARFEGHKGQVKEFLWRPRGTIIDGVDHREFQLVTWGTDQELRLHRMVPETLSAIGYEKGITQISSLNFTRRGAKYRTFRDEPSEEACDEVLDSQAGSPPAAGQYFHFRPGGSTRVGMSKLAIPHSQDWLQGSNMTARIGMHGRMNSRQTTNPIKWMKNVKITSWNPETLGEEISQVGEKFAKVVFESVDMPQRKAVISMHAPWGASSVPIFMKIDLKFPIAYPREAAAIFNVQKTAAMTDELAGMLSTGLRTIAETYVSRKRGCLEAVLRYLLREQDIEQIVSWILGESLQGSKVIDDIGLEVSSDEDEVGGTTFQGAAGIIDASRLLNANALVPVPKGCGASWADNGMLVCFFPRQPKQPKSFLETLGTRNNDNSESGKIFEGFGRLETDSAGAKTTIGTITSGEDQASEHSDESSLSSSSSSGSSDGLVTLATRFFGRDAWRAGGVNLQRSRSTDHSNHSTIGLPQGLLGADASNNVVSIHDLSELIPSKREQAMEYIVFGKGPDVCGYNADVATRHGLEDIAHIWRLMELILWNEVPLESISDLRGSSDILAVARSVSDTPKGNDSGVDLSYDRVIKRSKVVIPARVRWGESALGGKFLVPTLIHHFESIGDIQMLAILSCVFAEPRGANLSASLSQQQHHRHHHPSMQLNAPAFSVDYHPSFEVAWSLIDSASTTSFALANTTGKLLDPCHEALTTKAGHSYPTAPYLTGTTPPYTVQRLSHQQLDKRRSSRLSSADVREHNPSHSSTTAHAAIDSLPASPEDTRSTSRLNSHLAFPLSRASLSSLAPTFSYSPPNLSSGSGGNKKQSPVGSFAGHHVPASGWGTANIFGGSGVGRGKPEAGAQTARPRRSAARVVSSSSVAERSRSISSDGDAVEPVDGASTSLTALRPAGNVHIPLKSTAHQNTKRKLKIKSTLHNQNMFDNDGYASVPLLDASLEWKYRAYRASYARLLGAWGLHTQAAEVLKFDGLLGYFPSTLKQGAADRSVDDDELAGNLQRRKMLHINKNNFVQNRGLEIRRCCNQCGEMLQPIEKNGIPVGWHCAACALAGTRSPTQTLCAICTKSVAGLMVPCLNCGHTTCFDCHRIWLARDNKISTIDDASVVVQESAEKSCPTGCECICSSHQSVTVPYPLTSEDEDEQNQYDQTSQSPARALTTSEAADLISTHGPDTAIGAFLSLTRGRSLSSSKAAVSNPSKGKAKVAFPDNLTAHSQQSKEENVHIDAYTDARQSTRMWEKGWEPGCQ